MAITASTQIIYDGTVNCSVKMTGICDGTGGDEINTTKLDVSSLVPVGGRVRIDRIEYDVAYGAVKLAWDAFTPVDIAYLDGDGFMDFTKQGGMQNAADETATGNILLTTIGMDLNSTYTIVLRMRKKFKGNSISVYT